MKRFYALAVAALACVANANAQSEVKEDWDIVQPFDWEIGGKEGVAIYGVTATVKTFALQVAGLPVPQTGLWTPVVLGNGGVLKFFDNPEFDLPSEDTWSDADQELSDEYGWTWDDLAGYQGSATELPFDFVIEGEDNEIYLDSYCTMGGTITGSGDVTIYCTDRTQLNFVCAKTVAEEVHAFTGNIYLKCLDGYACDTLVFGKGFRIANEAGLISAGNYVGATSVLNVEGLNNAVLDMTAIGSKACIPPIAGKAVVKAGNMPHIYTTNGLAWYETPTRVVPIDYTLEGGGSGALELYSGTTWIRAPFNESGAQIYLRSNGSLIVDSEEPCFSNHTSSVSARGANSDAWGKSGFVGGHGYIDQYIDNNSNPVVVSAGHPIDNAELGWNALGELTVKGFTVRNGNVVRVNFAGDKSDVLNVVETYTFFSGRNDFNLDFASDYFNTATPGHYKVINAGVLDAGYTTVNDTIGYEVWDNNGSTYCIRSVHGGEVIIDAVTGEERTANPGDSIGQASFGDLEKKYGATIMDGNRPHYIIKEWGRGSYTDGKSLDDRYIGSVLAEYDGTYVINPDQIGTWARGAEGYVNDSLAWEAVWEQFKADHPCSDPRTAVGTDDPSVIPGTVGDSIFLTYSLRLNESGEWVGHSWSWKNGSGYESSVKGYPYAAAMTYAYYYYSNNTLYLNQSGTVLSPAGDSVAYSFSKQSLPATLYAAQLEQHATDVNGADSVYYVNDPASAYKSYSSSKISIPQADGSVIRYWFDLKNLMTFGVISLCYEKVDAEGNVTETNANAEGDCKDVDIVNSDQKLDIKTVIKEKHAVASRVIYSLDGKRLNTYAKGLNIVTTKFTDGSIETKKVFFAE